MSGQRVLIVEDDTVIRDFLSDALRMKGFATEMVADGAEAIRKLADGGIDVILSDVNMPNMNGIDLCRHVTAEHVDIPEVLITGVQADEDEGQLLRKSGAAALLRKPIRIQRLHEALCLAVNSADNVGDSASGSNDV